MHNTDTEEHHSTSHNPQVLLEWTAPIRPHKKPSQKIMRFYLALALLLSLFVLFFSETILLIPIWALLFLFYTLTTTPSQNIEHRVTKFGIESADITARWELLSHFYFAERFGHTILTIVSHPPFNHHLYFVVPTLELKKELINILSEHIIYQEKHQKTFIEKVIDWSAFLIPDDEEKTDTHSHATASR